MKRLGALVISLGLVACSGSATPDAKAPDSTPGAAPSPSADAAPAKPAGPHKTIAEHKQDFMSKCSSNGTAYCECAWGQMTALFSEDDMNTAGADDPRLETFKKNVGPACASKLPEDQIEKAYVTTCADDPKFVPFCECLWKEQRKKEPASIFLDPQAAKADAAQAVKRVAAKTCSSKMPEDFQRQVFLKGCGNGQDNLAPFCGCAWKSARTVMSPGEMGAGFLESDMPKIRPVIDKACGKLRPAAK